MRAFFIRPFRLPRSARHERGEGWGEGQFSQTSRTTSASSPRPSPPFRMEEKESKPRTVSSSAAVTATGHLFQAREVIGEGK